MKNIKLLLALLVACVSLSVLAQNTNTPPSGIADFGNTVLGYFTSFNTNLDSTFSTSHFDLWTGASSIQGRAVPLVNDLGFSYDFWKSTPLTNSPLSTALGGEIVERNSGVAGTALSAQGGIGFSLILHDVKASLYLDGGSYLSGKAGLYGEVGLRIKKAVGQHFFMGVGMGVQFPNNAQVFSAFGGATF